MKTTFSNKANFILLFSILVMTCFVSIVFVPFSMAAGMIVVISILITSGIVYSSVNYNFRHSSLKNNVNLTKNNRWLFYIATFATMIIVSSIVYEIHYCMLWILNNSNLLLVEWMQRANFAEGEVVYKFNIQLNLVLLYCALLTTMITFGISFIFQNVVENRNTYFIIIITLVILSIIFGGALNQYWLPNNDGVYRLADNLNLFPWKVYWLSMFFPYFAPGSIGVLAGYASKVRIVTETSYHQLDLYSNAISSYFAINQVTGEIYHKTMLGFFSFKNDPLWVFLMFTPYIEMVLFFIAGTVLSKVNRK